MKFKTPIDFFLNTNEVPHRLCDHKGCDGVGEHRAPKNRMLSEYYWFCIQHVQDYNKQWNYYAGMSAEEAEHSRAFDMMGERPTWPFGQAAMRLAQVFSLDEYIKGKRHFFAKETLVQPVHLTKSQRHALVLLEIEWPVDAKALKNAYKKMAKRYHPDMHGNDKAAEEKFKKVGNAYQTLLNLLNEKK